MVQKNKKSPSPKEKKAPTPKKPKSPKPRTEAKPPKTPAKEPQKQPEEKPLVLEEIGTNVEVAEDIASINFNTLLISLVALGFVLHYLGALLQPFFIAVIIYFLISPRVHFLSKHSVPKGLSFLVILFVFIFLFLILGFVVYKNVESFKQKTPYYQKQLLSLIDQFARKTGYADKQGRFDWEQYTLNPLIDVPSESLVTYLFGSLYGFLTNLAVVFFYLIFIILEAHKLPRRIEKAFPKKQALQILEIGANIDEGIKRYLVVKTAISFGTGAVAGLILFLFKQDYWILWAILTFLFNYIPYVGSLVVSIFPTLLAFLISGPVVGFWVALLLFANQTFWGNFLEPHIAGRQLGISPLVLLVMVAYWGWLWGIPGMILSVPFTVAIKIILANFEKTRAFSILLSND